MEVDFSYDFRPNSDGFIYSQQEAAFLIVQAASNLGKQRANSIASNFVLIENCVELSKKNNFGLLLSSVLEQAGQVFTKGSY